MCTVVYIGLGKTSVTIWTIGSLENWGNHWRKWTILRSFRATWVTLPDCIGGVTWQHIVPGRFLQIDHTQFDRLNLCCQLHDNFIIMINAKCLQRDTVWYNIVHWCASAQIKKARGEKMKNSRSEKYLFWVKRINHWVRPPLVLLDALLVARPLSCLVIWCFHDLLALDLSPCPLGSKFGLDFGGTLHMAECVRWVYMVTHYSWTCRAQMVATRKGGPWGSVDYNPEVQ